MEPTEEKWRSAAAAKGVARMARVTMFLVLCVALTVASGTIPRMFGLITTEVLAFLAWFFSFVAASSAWVATKSGFSKRPATMAKNMAWTIMLTTCLVGIAVVAAKKALPMMATAPWFEVSMFAMMAVVSAIAAMVASKQIERS